MRIFLALALFVSVHAHALEIEAAVGRTEFCCLQDGVWWQSQFGFNGSVRSAAWELGARQRFGNFGLHAAWSDLGTASGDNIAAMRDDDFGRINTSGTCDQATQHNCLGYFRTRQHIAGALAGASYGFTLWGFQIDSEAGKYFYKSNFSVTIWCPTCGTSQFGAEESFRSSSNIRRSTYFALRAARNNAFISVRRIANVNGSGDESQGQFSTGLTNGPVNQILVGAYF